MKQTLDNFIEIWLKQYDGRLHDIPLFSSPHPRLSDDNRQRFIRALYHFRGHFHDMLFYLGSRAPTQQAAKVIIENYQDEFGVPPGSKSKIPSHEELYVQFARAHGVNIIDEAVNNTTYLPFLQEYNRGHREFFLRSAWERAAAGFAAFELLDNPDYTALLSLARSFSPKRMNLSFFEVHTGVTHGKDAKEGLDIGQTWKEEPSTVKHAFGYIASHQLHMYKGLSELVLNSPMS